MNSKRKFYIGFFILFLSRNFFCPPLHASLFNKSSLFPLKTALLSSLNHFFLYISAKTFTSVKCGFFASLEDFLYKEIQGRNNGETITQSFKNLSLQSIKMSFSNFKNTFGHRGSFFILKDFFKERWKILLSEFILENTPLERKNEVFWALQVACFLGPLFSKRVSLLYAYTKMKVDSPLHTNGILRFFAVCKKMLDDQQGVCLFVKNLWIDMFTNKDLLKKHIENFGWTYLVPFSLPYSAEVLKYFLKKTFEHWKFILPFNILCFISFACFSFYSLSCNEDLSEEDIAYAGKSLYLLNLLMKDMKEDASFCITVFGDKKIFIERKNTKFRIKVCQYGDVTVYSPSYALSEVAKLYLYFAKYLYLLKKEREVPCLTSDHIAFTFEALPFEMVSIKLDELSEKEEFLIENLKSSLLKEDKKKWIYEYVLKKKLVENPYTTIKDLSLMPFLFIIQKTIEFGRRLLPRVFPCSEELISLRSMLMQRLSFLRMSTGKKNIRRENADLLKLMGECGFLKNNY